MQRGFQGPHHGSGLFALAVAGGSIAWMLYHYDGPWWQKLLLAGGLVGTYAIGLVLALAVFACLLWVVFYSGTLRAKARLRRIMRFARAGDHEAASRAAAGVLESFSRDYADVLEKDALLRLRVIEFAREAGPSQRLGIRILVRHAPNGDDVALALYEGREALAPDDLWSWLDWFHGNRPAPHRAEALAYAAARMDERTRERVLREWDAG